MWFSMHLHLAAVVALLVVVVFVVAVFVVVAFARELAKWEQQ